jgi:carbon starvation protein
MHALTLLITTLLVFAIAYRLYGKFIATKVLMLNDKRVTPAYEFRDGKDYHPTNKWVLFGHHFAAISGAGPLVGPVLAAQFGFLPGFLWILIGAVLAGAVHDMVILFASVRSKGLSISNIAHENLGPVAGLATGFAILFIIITALAGLAIVVVNALNESAWATFTIIITIPAALMVALWMYKIRPGKIVEASLIGVFFVLLGVIFGQAITNSYIGNYLRFTKETLAIAMAVYGFIASTLPVWLLLCPRDYLSSYMKIGTIFLLTVGIIIVNPVIHMPALTEFIHGGGAIIPGKVWPFVCITIACGAISGFHALIGTGTTPKMIQKESEILPIGYGAMLVEGIVSVLALIAATCLIPGDYFAINLSPDVFHKLGYTTQQLNDIQNMVGEQLAGRTGGAVSLAAGMSLILSSIPGMKTLMGYWYHFAIMFEALFIMTTVDTGTRVARYFLQELIKPVFPKLSSGNYLPAVLLTSAVITVSWGYLVFHGDIKSIWPMFGVANQLMATIALLIGTVVILKVSGKKRYGLITLLPGLFMAVTTISAGVITILENYLPMNTFQGNLNAGLTSIMIFLSLIILFESLRKMYNMRKELK